MSTSNEKAMRLALEALEDCRRDSRLKYEHKFHDKVIKALEEALAGKQEHEWVGLTDDEVKKIAYNSIEVKVARTIEAKLKEKNT